MTTAGDLIYGGTSGVGTRLATGSATQLLHGGTTPTWSAISLTADVSGTLAATNGGTGQATYAVGDVLYASTTTALSSLADTATGSALISGGVGVAPSYGKIGLTTHVSGTLAIGSGGTGQTTASTAFNALSPMTTAGDLIYGGASGVGTRLATGSATQLLHGGTTPTWSAISLTADVSGTLAATNGGTGQTTYTSGGLLYASSTSALASSAAYTAGQVLYGGGSGTAPGSSASLVWDSTNSRLGIGTAPGRKLHVYDAVTSGSGPFVVDQFAASGFTDNVTLFRTAQAATSALNMCIMQSSSGTNNLFYVRGDGYVWAANDITAFSDARVKTNLQKIEGALDKVSNINGYTFTRTDYTNEGDRDKRYVGVIAQEIQKVLPELVHEDEKGMLSVAYGNMTALLIEALKEERAERLKVDERLARLEKLLLKE